MRTGVVFLLGLLTGAAAVGSVMWWRQHSDTPAALVVTRVGSEDVMLPAGARVEQTTDGGSSATWVDPATTGTRCGQRAGVMLAPARPFFPEVSLCGTHDFFAGSSAEGECPVTTVCLARRGSTELTCLSDDASCLSIAKAFARR